MRLGCSDRVRLDDELDLVLAVRNFALARARHRWSNHMVDDIHNNLKKKKKNKVQSQNMNEICILQCRRSRREAEEEKRNEVAKAITLSLSLSSFPGATLTFPIYRSPLFSPALDKLDRQQEPAAHPRQYTA